MSGYLVRAGAGTSALKAALVHPDRGVVSVAEHAYQMHRTQLPGEWIDQLARIL